jgi:hypothetical protein
MEDRLLKQIATVQSRTPGVNVKQAHQGRRVKLGSSRIGNEFSEAIIEVCELINCDLKDTTQVSRRLAKLFKSLTYCSSVEVSFLEDASLRFAQTQQEFSRLPIDESSLQGYVASTKSYCVINNPGTSLTYAKFPIKLKAFQSVTGEPMDALSIACVPIVVSPT